MATETADLHDNKHLSQEREEHSENDKSKTAPKADKPGHSSKRKNRKKRCGAGESRKKNTGQTDRERNSSCDNLHNTSGEEKEDSGKEEEEKENDPEQEPVEEEGSEDYDPLKADLFERLQLESGADTNNVVSWDEYSVQDMQTFYKKLAYSERQFNVFLMAVFGGMIFALVFGLFVFQVQVNSNSHEILTTHVHRLNKEIPKRLYSLYFDYLDSTMVPDLVDLRANTTIFVH